MTWSGNCQFPPHYVPEEPNARAAIEGMGQDNSKFRVVDGDPGESVQCTVTAMGRVESQVQASAPTFGNVSFTVNGQVGATGSVSVYGSRMGLSMGDPACTLTSRFLKEGGGAAYVDYSCAMFADNVNTCMAGGTFILENCDK